MSSSSPVKTPKLHFDPEQPSTGEYWIPPRKDTPCLRAKEKPQQDSRRDETTFRIKPHICRDAQRAQTKPCVHQDPETPKRLSQTCLSVFECLLQRHRSAVACHGDRSSRCRRPETCSMWYKPY